MADDVWWQCERLTASSYLRADTLFPPYNKPCRLKSPASITSLRWSRQDSANTRVHCCCAHPLSMACRISPTAVLSLSLSSTLDILMEEYSYARLVQYMVRHNRSCYCARAVENDSGRQMKGILYIPRHNLYSSWAKLRKQIKMPPNNISSDGGCSMWLYCGFPGSNKLSQDHLDAYSSTVFAEVKDRLMHCYLVHNRKQPPIASRGGRLNSTADVKIDIQWFEIYFWRR